MFKNNIKKMEDKIMKDIKVCYGIDVDCVAGWLGSYGGEDSPCDISRGVFAGRVGIPRFIRQIRN